MGSLIYAMCCTRPDLSYVLTKLSQKMTKRTERDLKFAKGVLGYIKGTINHALYFRKSKGTTISGSCDADWANAPDRCSVSGYMFCTNQEGYVSWKTKKQKTVALSTCEAEYMSLAHCVLEAIYLSRVFRGLYGQDCIPMNIGVDNQGAIQLAKNPVKQSMDQTHRYKISFCPRTGCQWNYKCVLCAIQ